jgi:DNA-binding CsgD family transcriptional regulator
LLTEPAKQRQEFVMSPREGEVLSRRDRQLVTLERLLGLDAIELRPTLDHAAQALIDVLAADKVDIFLHEPAIHSLVALGVSDTPMGRREQELGLDRMPVTNGGRAVDVFESGEPHLGAHVDQDPGELRGIWAGLGARSQLAAPIDVAGQRRGVLSVLAAVPEAYTDGDLAFVVAVARWIGLVIQRHELIAQVAREARERGRREAIEELIGRLSPREREVAALVMEGLSNAEIARKLVITEGTAANHLRSILLKLEVPNRARVAAIMAQLGIDLPGEDGAGPK